ncbi:hypothetical protein EV714DRAFT_268696 [Schizophyllum commune]
MDLCNRLGFSGMGLPPTFDLDDIMNGILLESPLHVNWDMYATFAIIVPQSDLDNMIRQLRLDNTIWDEQVGTDKRAVRVLGVAEPRIHDYTIRELTVVALSPPFLPQGSALAVMSHEHRSLVHTHPTEWQQLRLHGGNEHCHHFQLPPSRRERTEQLSIFALIVNAFHKFQTWHLRQTSDDAMIRATSLSSESLLAYDDALRDAIKEIFHVPYMLDADVMTPTTGNVQLPPQSFADIGEPMDIDQ